MSRYDSWGEARDLTSGVVVPLMGAEGSDDCVDRPPT